MRASAPAAKPLQHKCREVRFGRVQAIGKVTSYAFSADGGTGALTGLITIGCAVGYGGAIAQEDGDPT